jgi:hypothetical protein
LRIAAKRPRSRTRSGARSALFEQLRLNREMEQMFARDAARRQRKAAKQRRRREQAKALDWVERGYGARP